MDIFERYCGKKTYRLFALMIDVPGTNALHRKIFVTFCVLVLSFATCFQVLLLITDGFTLKHLVSIIPTTAAIFGSLVYILYLSFATHIQVQYQCILSIMRLVLNEKHTLEESMIREKYAGHAKLFMNVYTVVFVSMLIGMSVSGFIPSFLDIIIPLNHTRKNELIYEGDIFLNQEKYFYHIYFIECLSVYLTGALVIAGVNMCVIIVQYSCGMLAVLGYQLENLTETRAENISEMVSYEQMLMRRLQMCINSHQTIIRYSLLVAEFHDIPVTLIVIGSFCTLTMSLIQVTDPDLISVKIILYIVGQTIQLFLVSMMGQYLMDASLQTSEDAYNVKWDICPGSVRRMLHLMILRSSKPCYVMARGIYVLSVENFMSVIQTVVSFYMVLRQVQ